MAIGAILSGSPRVVDGQVRTDGPTSWLTPVAMVIGALALALCAYLPAVYLTNETQGELREDFSQRALLAGTWVVALAVVALPLLYVGAPHLWSGLIGGRATPVLALGLARLATILQVALLLPG